MNRNYQKELDRIIQKRGQKVPRVLLHACCGVCSGAVLEYLTQYFDVTVLWYNPNLYPQTEFDRRFKALDDRKDGPCRQGQRPGGALEARGLR